jgi:hypothetical protein
MSEQRYLLEDGALSRRIAHIKRTDGSNRLVIVVERRGANGDWTRAEVRVVQDTADRSSFDSALREMLARFPAARRLD